MAADQVSAAFQLVPMKCPSPEARLCHAANCLESKVGSESQNIRNVVMRPQSSRRCTFSTATTSSAGHAEANDIRFRAEKRTDGLTQITALPTGSRKALLNFLDILPNCRVPAPNGQHENQSAANKGRSSDDQR